MVAYSYNKINVLDTADILDKKIWLHQNVYKFLLKLATNDLLTTQVGKQFHKSTILSLKDFHLSVCSMAHYSQTASAEWFLLTR